MVVSGNKYLGDDTDVECRCRCTYCFVNEGYFEERKIQKNYENSCREPDPELCGEGVRWMSISRRIVFD
jgi:hypothetical protein